MRSTIGRCILALILAAPLACGRSTTAPATPESTSLRPAPSPGEAVERSWQAMIDGDEATYRQTVDVRSPHGYSRAYVRWLFAAARLHQAVREHNVTGQRLRAAGFDRNQTLSRVVPSPPSAEEWAAIRKSLQAIEWEVDGDVARPKGEPSIFRGGTPGEMSLERSGGGWVVVLSDPVTSAPPEHLQHFAQAWSATATVLDAATEQVRAGRLKTIVAVNDFVDAELKKVAPPRNPSTP